MKLNYTEDNIQTMKGLGVVRQSPSQFLPDTDVLGQTYLWKEPIDNSIDELVQKRLDGDTTPGELTILFFLGEDRYQIVIDDNGRGIPLGKLKESFTEMHTSGKYDSSAYETSSGLFGVGGKAAAGLSSQFRAISRRPDGIGDLKITFKSEIAEFYSQKCERYGTTVILEPEASIFGIENITEYANGAYNTLVDLLKMYSIFSEYTIRVGIFKGNNLFLKNFIKPELSTILDKLQKYFTSKEVVILNTEPLDYLKNVNPMVKNVTWKSSLDLPYDRSSNIGFNVNLYYAGLANGSIKPIALVNYVPISDINSSHNQAVYNAIKQVMVQFINNNDIAKYFLEKYQLPICMVNNIKCKGAKFSGTTKHAFRNKAFQDQMTNALLSMLNEGMLITLYTAISKDIENQYAKDQFGNTPKQMSNTKLLLALNFPDKFKDCSTTNRQEAELFLIEGDSANTTEGRDSVRQASYALRGKPINALRERNPVSKLSSNDIFHDIILITGLNHGMDTFDTLRYGKLMIMADADSHGKHICNLLIGNFYTLNPKIITSGIIHIVIPPLYALRVRNKKNIVYVYSSEEFINVLSNNLYGPSLDITISTDKEHGKVSRKLSGSEYVDFVSRVIEIGEIIDSLSNRLGIEDYLIEQLAYVHKYLSPEHMNIQEVRSILNNPGITYRADTRTLIISIDKTDHIVSLDNVGRAMAQSLMTKMRNIGFEYIDIRVTTKHTDVYKDASVSLVTLYKTLKTLDTVFDIERYKGLASMQPMERAHTCLDPRYRYTYQITSLDDIDKLYGILGKDPAIRKQLLTQSSESALNKYTLFKGA